MPAAAAAAAASEEDQEEEDQDAASEEDQEEEDQEEEDQEEQDQEECEYCFEGASAERGPLLSPGCACRGTKLHLGCLAGAAAARPRTPDNDPWKKCPACQQPFGGEMWLGLCRERWRLVAGRPEDHGERLEAAQYLVVALRQGGRTQEALRLGEDTLDVARRKFGDDHPGTHATIAALALVHMACGQPEQALELNLETEEVTRRNCGPTAMNSLACKANVAASHAALGDHALAAQLYRETLDTMLRVHPNEMRTFMTMGSLATVHIKLEDNEAALRLLRDSLAGMRRLFGDDHPRSMLAKADLARHLCLVGKHAEATPLFEEASAGFAALSGGGEESVDAVLLRRWKQCNAKRETDGPSREDIASECAVGAARQLERRVQSIEEEEVDEDGLYEYERVARQAAAQAGSGRGTCLLVASVIVLLLAAYIAFAIANPGFSHVDRSRSRSRHGHS
jgi:hypothetical protein